MSHRRVGVRGWVGIQADGRQICILDNFVSFYLCLDLFELRFLGLHFGDMDLVLSDHRVLSIAVILSFSVLV